MKRKLSPLVRAMTLYAELDERDKTTLADWIRSQTAAPRKVAVKKPKVEKKGVSTFGFNEDSEKVA